METEEENVPKANKRKESLAIDWDELLPTGAGDDDRPPELVVTSEKKFKGDTGGDGDAQQSQTEDSEIQSKSDYEIREAIERYRKNITLLSSKVPDKGEKLKASLRRHEEELQRRKKLQIDKKDSRTVNTFEDELSCIHPCQGRKGKQNGRVSGRGRSRILLSSRPAPSPSTAPLAAPESLQCPSTLSVDSEKHHISNDDNSNSHSATSSRHQLVGNKPASSLEYERTNSTQDPPSRNLRPRHRRTYNLVDEEPLLQNTIQHGEKFKGGDVDALQSQKEDSEIQSKSDYEIREAIERYRKNITMLSSKLPDKGEKLKGTLRKHEEELQRRKKLQIEKGDNGCEGTIQLSHLSSTFPRWERERVEVTNDETDDLQANNEVRLENSEPFDFESTPSTPTTQGPSSSAPTLSRTSTSKGKKRKAPVTSDFSSELKEITCAMNNIAQAILSTHTQVWKTNEIFDALRKIRMEGSLLFDAVEWLVEHPNLIGIFFGCPEEMRFEWLAKKMEL